MKKITKTHLKKLEEAINKFNKEHPVGSIVRTDGVPPRVVTCPASIVGGHSAVAWYEGIQGGFILLSYAYLT